MPGFLGGNKAAAGGVPPGMNLKNALIQAAPLFASMAAGYSSGRGPYAYMDQGIASIQANQKAKRDEEDAAAAAAAFGNLRPGGMGAAGGGGYGGGSGYTPPTAMPKANLGGVSGMGEAGIGFAGLPKADMGMVGNGGLSFGGSKLPPGQAEIRAGLISRGYSEAAADGIMMNMADESGFNPSAVGDSGNALGLAQWNGPRKAALEAFAAQQGKSPTDIGVQLDFLDMELKGSEAAAGSALMSAKTAPEAAAIFLNQFERPAEDHRARREAAYLGGATPPVASGPADPLSDPYVQQLMTVMSMPGITPEQQAVIQMQLQSRIQTITTPPAGAEDEAARSMRARDADLLGYTRGSPEWNQYVVTGEMPAAADPMDALNLEKAQLEIDALKNPMPDDGAVFDSATDLRKEWIGMPAVKAFETQSAAMARLEAAATDPSAAGDMAMLYGYMKLLDPSSVVRETEFATAAASGSLPEQIQGYATKLLNGQRLTPEQRADFLTRAQMIYQGAEAEYDAIRNQYIGIAERNKLPVADAVPDFRYSKGVAPVAPPASGAGTVIDGYTIEAMP